jgi:hypothetical protein
VKLVFNLSQGEDERGPCNEEPDFEYVENPEPEGALPPDPINQHDEGHKPSSGRPKHPEGRRALDAERVAPD